MFMVNPSRRYYTHCKIKKYSTFYLQENDIIAFEIVFVEIKWNIYEMLGKVTDSHSSSKNFWM